ncbi:ThiF family adenylyltransferase, partial [Acinetobacter baumannii]
KVASAQAAIARLNPDVCVNALQRRLDADAIGALLQGVSVVLDCSDNFGTRQATNLACVRAGVPLVSGAAIRFDGQISVFDSRT